MRIGDEAAVATLGKSSADKFKPDMAECRDTATGYYEQDLLVVIMVVKLGAVASTLEAYQVYAYSLESYPGSQGSGVANGVVVELMLVTNFFQFIYSVRGQVTFHEQTRITVRALFTGQDGTQHGNELSILVFRANGNTQLVVE